MIILYYCYVTPLYMKGICSHFLPGATQLSHSRSMTRVLTLQVDTPPLLGLPDLEHDLKSRE